MLGAARHAWTVEQNRALWEAAHDQVGVPILLDPLWLTFLQIAVAGAAVIGIGMFVLAEAGRAQLKLIAEAEAQLQEARTQVAAVENECEAARRVRDEADIAINVVAAEALEAEACAETLKRKWEAERSGDAAATRAAVARKNHMYWTEEKTFANGDCWLAQRPDPWTWRTARNPARVCRRDGAPPGQRDAPVNGHVPKRAAGVEDLVHGSRTGRERS